ncbi:hypothetical protein [Streptomyces sp. CB02056]|uniref:hypothetical protein n=1 Tax=Streptomyces sp. CB02056 TaxID=1703924 RepID=UPI00093C6D79|nr:hypothetical protein [Streptomyces sp. CB02056]OKH97548.1 hypothetical protein AMK13_38260 [Streptomyces sp. CB02056]
MTLHGAPGTGIDASRLAEGSLTADALTAMGPNGLRALGHLRDARQKLAEPGRWSQPMESVLASCRSALDSLLKEAGEDFEGPRDAQEQVNREVEALLKKPAGMTGPLEKLHAVLDGAADVPDALEPRAGIGAGVQRLIRMPAERLPVPIDPRPEYDAERDFLAAVARLETLPSSSEEQRELVAVLRRLQQARRDSGAAARAALPDALAGLREAFAYRVREQQDGGAFRRRQLTQIVRQRTGTAPGDGEQEAFAAWARFYRATSGVLHGSSGDGEESTRRLFADLVAHVEQLVLDLPDLAPLLVALVHAEAPTVEDAEAVAALQQPRGPVLLHPRRQPRVDGPDQRPAPPAGGRSLARPALPGSGRHGGPAACPGVAHREQGRLRAGRGAGAARPAAGGPPDRRPLDGPGARPPGDGRRSA